MPSFEHKKLVEKIGRLDEMPAGDDAFREWTRAGKHLDFLVENAKANEVVIYGSGSYSFVHSLIVPLDKLTPPKEADLLKWSSNPYTSAASYVYGGGRDDIWIERGDNHTGSKALDAGMHLVYGRDFEGWSGKDRRYFELNQEYTHLTAIHWRPEHASYCKFDGNGDLRHVVSISNQQKPHPDVILVSAAWPELEEYLAISESALVRMFDFMLLKRDAFSGWPDGPETIHRVTPDFFYRQKIAGNAAYSRGVQIVRPRQTPAEAAQGVKDGWSRKKDGRYVEFIAHDWRNKVIAKISTDPTATTNYFVAESNDKPFELSPAYFRPEVLLKYKGDKEKYRVEERSIHCRVAWYLKGYDVNEAGQVHAYICDLRALPYEEQLHWLSYNEAPKTDISERAFINDFKGEWVTFMHPLQEIRQILQRWRNDKADWWKLRDSVLFDAINAPVTSSRDEWAEAFMDLSKLVAEGFDVSAIRGRLDHLGVQYDPKEQSIALLERLVAHATHGSSTRLEGLRTVQKIRSVVKGHSGGSEANKLATEAISEHGGFPEHYREICSRVVVELEAMERVM